MKINFDMLKAAIVEVNEKFPNLIDLDKDRNGLSEDFMVKLGGLTDAEWEQLPVKAANLYNNAVKQAEAAEKIKKKVSKMVAQRRSRVKYEGADVSTTTRATVLICENMDMSCLSILNLLTSEGRKIAKSTLDTIYVEDHKVFGYLASKGILPGYDKEKHND